MVTGNWWLIVQIEVHEEEEEEEEEAEAVLQGVLVKVIRPPFPVWLPTP